LPGDHEVANEQARRELDGGGDADQRAGRDEPGQPAVMGPEQIGQASQHQQAIDLAHRDLVDHHR
jgi:hypothetical protein